MSLISGLVPGDRRQVSSIQSLSSSLKPWFDPTRVFFTPN
jgi:hypothetical protein